MPRFFPIFMLPLTVVAAELSFPEAHFPALHQMLAGSTVVSPELRRQAHWLEVAAADAGAAAAQERLRVHMHTRIAGQYVIREDIDAQYQLGGYGSLQVTRPLWHWGAPAAVARAGRMGLEAAGEEMVNTRQQHAQAVRGLYLRWALASHRRALLEQSRELAERFLRSSETLAAAGVRASAETMEMELRVRERLEELGWLQREVGMLARELHDRTGIDPASLPLPEDFAGDHIPTAAALQALRRQFGEVDASTAPQVRRAHLLASMHDASATALAKDRLPKVDFVAGLFSDRLDSVNASDSVLRLQSFVGVQISWNIWDGRLAESRHGAALARRRAHEAEATINSDRVRRDAAALWDELDFDVERIQTRRARLALAEQRLRVARSEAARDRIALEDHLRVELDAAHTRHQVREAEAWYWLHLGSLAALYQTDPYASSNP